MTKAQDWIDRLDLSPHPEGGYFRETYRSPLTITWPIAGDEPPGTRSLATSIYFLLTSDNFSALHRLRSDEIWFHHAGHPLTIHVIEPDGTYKPLRLGFVPDGSTQPQALVPAGCWFGSTVDEPGGFALVGCVVAPGFDFADFEMGARETMLKDYPQHAEIIRRLTRITAPGEEHG